MSENENSRSGGLKGRSLRTRWVVASALVVVILGLGGLAVWNYHWGAQWRDTASRLAADLASESARADRLATQLVGAEARLRTTGADLEERRAELQDVNAELEQMEGRVRTLGNEKAQLEDEREIAEASADYFLTAASELAVVGSDLDVCVQDLIDWFGDQPGLYSSQYAWDRWSAQADSVGSQCAWARDSFWSTYNTYFGFDY